MFEECFRNTALNYTAENKIIDLLWQEIFSAYTASSRKYHNLNHLNSLLNELQPVRDQIIDWDIMVFSAAYHDIVYNVLKTNNEEKSAELAELRLNMLGLEKERIRICCHQILATKSHSYAIEVDTAYFTDADLAILGYSNEEYQEYARLVRKEYKYYPDLVYNPGRRKVLLHFLNMDRIYKTTYFYDRYEEQARTNMKSELEKLK